MLHRTLPLPSLARQCLRNNRRLPARGLTHASRSNGLATSQSSTLPRQKSRPLALIAFRPFTTSLQRYQDTSKYLDEHKLEERFEKEKLEQRPDQVSAESSVHPVFNEVGQKDQEEDTDMLGEIKSDLKVIRETFALNEVPREAYLIGFAGVLPYAATSAATCFLAWDINHADLDGHGLFLSGDTAQQLLTYIEPLQIGYGAVIISFLGAVHWGLEWAGYGGHHGFRRYAYGVFTPAVAWPTTFMSVEYALITQFASFVVLYYADARATTNGWVPPWYSSYRFALTFIVGAAIVATLISRGEIVDKLHRLPNPGDRVQHLKSVQMEEMEKEEKYKQEKALEEDEEEEGEEASAGDDEQDEEEEEE